MTIQYDQRQPSFYDVSLVDGYNLPVSVTSYKPVSSKCLIRGCNKNLKDTCPPELQVRYVELHGQDFCLLNYIFLTGCK